MLWSVWVPISAQQSPDLRGALVAKATAAQALLSSAGSVASNSANGHSTALADFGAGQVTLTEVVESWVYLVELYDISASEITSVAVSDIEAQMELNLRPIVNTTGNFMYLSK